MNKIPLVLKNRKPYIETQIQHNDAKLSINTLIDTGNGDAMWLFPPLQDVLMPIKGFEDKLGVGLSGNVKGLRSKLTHVSLGKYTLNKVTVSLPEEESLANRSSKDIDDDERNGSIGGELLGRFKVFFDYRNKSLYLRARADWKDGFYYNMAGLEIMEGDLEVFTEITNTAIENADTGYGRSNNTTNIGYLKQRNFILAPEILISYVRPGSLAEAAGLKIGDVVVKVNGTTRTNLTRNSILRKFFQNPYSYLRFRVRRDDEILKFKFQLVPLI